MPLIYHDTRQILYQTIEGKDAGWEHAAKRIFGKQKRLELGRWRDFDMRDAYIMLRWAELGNIPPASKLVATIISPRGTMEIPGSRYR